MIKEPRQSRGVKPVSEQTHALGSRRVGDFDPLPDRPPIHDGQTLVDQLLNPRQPFESGEWSEAGGYVRDETPEEKAAKAALVAEIKRHATGR
jgi:hypothetical protein